ncbi:hypothetical protein NEHOM01_1306 [Nematocida homosporus]|uniref:uncharacterized protein n=1 Tax=Nematocida homosporus TaxID=1912981 RepID=UPI00221F7D05|nr:uncharacterized protein NEHOM01_1306 [Nematocida homosporus]KAI5186141.1 hypothetical protein NEHOM01_1306 [Nematocida homosporus]
MQLGLSLDALIAQRTAKEQLRKQKKKEIQKRIKDSEKLDRPNTNPTQPSPSTTTTELSTTTTTSESTTTTTTTTQSKPTVKKRRLNRDEKTLILDSALARTPEDIREINEKELKEVLKVVVKVLNTLPSEPIKIMAFPEDRDPHANPSSRRGSDRSESQNNDSRSGRNRKPIKPIRPAKQKKAFQKNFL